MRRETFGLLLRLCLVFCLFVSCKEQNGNLLSLTFDVSKTSQVLLSDIAGELTRIELETTDSLLIKRIRQVELFDGYLLVLALTDESNRLCVFDRQGNFVRTIGSMGQGPGEYQYCPGFVLKGKEILLRTNVGILAYDIFGNFIRKDFSRMPFSAFYADRKFYSLNHNFVDKGGEYSQDFYFFVYDDKWNVLDSTWMHGYESNRLEVRTINAQQSIFQDGDHVYAYYPDLWTERKPVSDTLYIVENNTLRPFASAQFTHTQKGIILRFVTSGRYVIVEYIDNTNPGSAPHFLCLYDTETKEQRLVKDGFTDDILDGEHAMVYLMYQQGMFYFIREGEYSEELKMEPNPTVYIGRFKR